MSRRKIGVAAALATAAVIMVASNGSAAKGTTKTTYIQLDGYCDVFTLTVFPWHQAGEWDSACDGVDAVGSGMEGKVTGVSPKDLTIGETYFGDTSSTYLWNIEYPLITGGTWSIYKSSDGVNFSYFNGGTYTIVTAGAKPSSQAGQPVHVVVRK